MGQTFPAKERRHRNLLLMRIGWSSAFFYVQLTWNKLVLATHLSSQGSISSFSQLLSILSFLPTFPILLPAQPTRPRPPPTAHFPYKIFTKLCCSSWDPSRSQRGHLASLKWGFTQTRLTPAARGLLSGRVLVPGLRICIHWQMRI